MLIYKYPTQNFRDLASIPSSAGLVCPLAPTTTTCYIVAWIEATAALQNVPSPAKSPA